jgi:hypothetical protein
MPGEQQGQSHQVSNLSIGPDGKLYVHNGDGLGTPATALNLNSYRGKVLRDEPQRLARERTTRSTIASDGINRQGLRLGRTACANPFGGAWAQVGSGQRLRGRERPRRRPGREDPAPASTRLEPAPRPPCGPKAIYNWSPAPGPVNSRVRRGTAFGRQRVRFRQVGPRVRERIGPPPTPPARSPRGKRIQRVRHRLQHRANGTLVGGPRNLGHYTGKPAKAPPSPWRRGRAGLYFSDFYVDDPSGGYYRPPREQSPAHRLYRRRRAARPCSRFALRPRAPAAPSS